MANNQRQLCYQALMQVFDQGGYSSVSLRKVLREQKFDGSENFAGWVSAVFYGVLEQSLTLDFVIEQYQKPKRKLDLEVRVILKIGIYQLLFLDHVPDHVAVHETVALCYYAKKNSAKGFVNAILRNVIRDGKEVNTKGLRGIEKLSVEYSCPSWLIEEWTAQYGVSTTTELLQACLGRPPLTVRVNTIKTTLKALQEKLERQGIIATSISVIENSLELKHTGNIELIPAFVDGEFYVQDLASQICAQLVDAQPHMTLLDMCAAPGSKTFTMAQHMNGCGRIIACDWHEHKLDLIEKTAKRLGITIISTLLQDATKMNSALPQVDRILCDVPCSGLGVIRRKPEIKYKEKTSFQELPKQQRCMLEQASSYLKVGGKLIYSTCTLRIEENEAVIMDFLKKHQNFSLQPIPHELEDKVLKRQNMMTFLPQYMNSDGFFVAVMIKQRP